MGKPGFPIPLRKGCALTFAQAGGWGKPGFPMFTSAVHAAAPHNAAMNIAWERGRPALVASPWVR